MSLVDRHSLAGLDPFELVARFGSPLYVYDLDLVERRVGALRAALPDRVDVAYAVKANPALAVVAHLGALGLGADVASAGELALVARAGVPGSRVVMTGPGKRDDELRAAVEAGIRAITVESLGELARLEAIAAQAVEDGRLGSPVPVMLRASTGERPGRERVRLVGDADAGKFGMRREDLVAAGRRAAASPNLQLVGLHAFGASNVLDADALIAHVVETAERARDLAASTGLPIVLVDAGGGLGIPYRDAEAPLDLDRLGIGLADVLEGWAGDPLLRDARLLIEPGRHLVGPAGAYLARVVDRKVLGERPTLVLDGGIHHLLRPALVREEQRVVGFRADGAAEAGPEEVGSAIVAGPLCTGLDVLARAIPLGDLEPGDLVAVLDAGAYGFTESMPLFLSHPIPAEVVVRGGRAEIARPRVEPAAWLDVQRIPDWDVA